MRLIFLLFTLASWNASAAEPLTVDKALLGTAASDATTVREAWTFLHATVAAAARKKEALPAAVIEKIEARYNEAPRTRESVDTLRTLYAANADQRFTRLFLVGPWQRQANLADTDPEMRLWFVALMAEVQPDAKDPLNHEARAKRAKIDTATYLSDRTLKPWEFPRRAINWLTLRPKQAAPTAAAVQSYYTMIVDLIDGGRWVGDGKPDFVPTYPVSSYLMALLLRRQPEIAAKALEPRGSFAALYLMERLAECAAHATAHPFEQSVAALCRTEVESYLRKDASALTLASILGRTPETYDGTTEFRGFELMPEFPGIDRKKLPVLGDREVFALPIGAKDVDVTTTVPGRLPGTAKCSPASADSLLRLDGSAPTGAETAFCLRGSDDHRGAYYAKLRETRTLPDNLAADVHLIGLRTDAYARRGKEVPNLKFWVASSFAPAAGTRFVAVRWYDDAPPLLDFPRLLDRKTFENLRDEVFASPALAEYRAALQKRKPDILQYWERWRDEFIAAAAPMKNGVDAAVKAFFAAAPEHQRAKSVESVRCTSGCALRTPIATEPGTNWAVFAVAPGHRGPLVFETVVSPLVVQPAAHVANARSGFVPLAFGFMELAPEGVGTSRFVPTVRTTGLEYQPMLPWHVERKGNPALLYYVESLHRHMLPSGMFHPKSLSPDAAAIAALFRLAAVESLERQPVPEFPNPSADPTPAPKGPPVPQAPSFKPVYEQRVAAAKAATPLIAVAIHEAFGGPLERNVLLAFSRLPAVAEARRSVEAALRNEKVLAEADILRLVETGQDAVGAGSSPAKQLHVSLGDARHQLLMAEKDLGDRLRLSCLALRRLQYGGSRLVPKLAVRPEALDVCDEWEESR